MTYHLTVKNLASYTSEWRRRSALAHEHAREASVTLPSGERRQSRSCTERVEALSLDLTMCPPISGVYRLEGVLLGRGGVEETALTSSCRQCRPAGGDVTPARPGEIAAVYEGLIEAPSAT